MPDKYIHTVSVVIPVYRPANALNMLVDEIYSKFCENQKIVKTSNKNLFQVSEIILVNDCGDRSSEEIIRHLASKYKIVLPVWLSRNFGQHAATLAGIASSSTEWIFTVDEDGQHDPSYLPEFLDTAIKESASVVYASPINRPKHGLFRNLASSFTKWISKKFLVSGEFEEFNSFRLILGEIGRSVAAYVGNGIYLDIALTWVSDNSTTVPVNLRNEVRPSGYSMRKLLTHFGRLIISSGGRPLRVIAIVGSLVSLTGFLLSLYLIWVRLTEGTQVTGWTSILLAILIIGGFILISIGVLAEFLGALLRINMGKPLYLIVNDPKNGPLREPTPSSE